MTTPPSFGLSQSNVDVLDDCVRIIRATGLKGPTIKGAPITDALDETAKDIRNRILDAETFHSTVCSLLALYIDEVCAVKAEAVEPHQLTPDEASRYEANDDVIRLRREFAMQDADLNHCWCPECFDSGLLTPLQSVDIGHGLGGEPRYCSECGTAHVKISSLVSQFREFVGEVS